VNDAPLSTLLSQQGTASFQWSHYVGKTHHRMIQECKQEKKNRSKNRETMSYYKAGSFSEMLHDDDKRHENKSGWAKNL